MTTFIIIETIVPTLLAIGTVWFISPLNKKTSEDMKQLFFLGSLGSPMLFTIIALFQWFLIIRG